MRIYLQINTQMKERLKLFNISIYFVFFLKYVGRIYMEEVIIISNFNSYTMVR